MKKKIMLIYPPSPVMNREDRCQQPTKDLLVIPPLPPMDLMYMAAVAESAGLEAKIVDFSLEDKNRKTKGREEQAASRFSSFTSRLSLFKPDYLVINVASTTLENDLSALAKAKEILPDVVTIAKGAHFLTDNTGILYKYKSLDIIIVGEAEEVLKEILEEKSLAEIKGICYRDGIAVKYTGNREFIKNLDEIPFPARHLVDNSLFKRPDNGKVQAIIKVSRGCPHHCFFCLATPVSGSKVRLRSFENILAEIKECVEKYRITNFLFWSDIFNFDRQWTTELCEAIIENGLKITWSSNTRADTADDKTAQLMYKSGCRLVSIGAESGSQYILDKIGKKITINDIRNTVKIFKKAKIKTYNYFVIGLPWDDEDTIGQTIDFAIELDSDFVSFYTATPLPGSRFFRYAKEHNLLKKENSWENAYYEPVVKTHCLSKEKIMELHKQAVKRFYLRPSYVLRTLINIRSFAEIKNYFFAGIRLLLRK